MDRRSFGRVPIRMSCQVSFSSGVTIYGITRDLSFDGVTVESSSMLDGKNTTLAMGESGMLTLQFKKGAVADSILVRCLVKHAMANVIGLSASFSELSKKEQALIGQMLASGTAEVDPE